jgi:hypothetical protein
MVAESAKVLLAESNLQRYKEFILNSNEELSLPALSSVPWIGATKRRDVYKKQPYPVTAESKSHQIKFISKNEKPHAFFWQTNAEKLKQGVRWGIVKTHSITGKVLSSLGQYRIVAHERVMKGLVSNSQAVKLKLLDLYQDRFAALQDIESLVNKNNAFADYQKTIEKYLLELDRIEHELNNYFSEVECTGLNEKSFRQIVADIQADKARATAYLQKISKATDLRPYNRGRGKDSVLEFVKQQMMHGLYELQGINQDMTFSAKRYFALTRGTLNDFIEDARKEIDDHEADLRNAVTVKHHGHYANSADEVFMYDFSREDLSIERQQQVLMAISFIEEWDVLKNKKGMPPVISNGEQEETLEPYAATRWRTHRSIKATVKSISSFILNIFKGLFVSTRHWEEEDWQDKSFHLNAAKLREHIKPKEPMWKKPVYFAVQIFYALKDMFNGIRDFGTKLVIKMPEDIVNDWASTKEPPSLEQVLKGATEACQKIDSEEQESLQNIFKWTAQDFKTPLTPAVAQFAEAEYELSAGEFNDILNSVVRGINGFSSVFTHNIYAKDPVGGLVFTATYLAGIGMIYMPAYSASVFGSTLVNAFNSLSYAMASSPMGAAVAGGSTLAEVSAVIWDGFAHGPSGLGVNALYQIGEDPLAFGTYCAVAYGLGYLLVNGIGGHKIPWLSHMLQEDLGTDPSTGYPIIGAKFAIMFYESLITHQQPHHEQPSLVKENHDSSAKISEEGVRLVNRFILVTWLSTHAKMLSKLDEHHKFALEQQLDRCFSKEESGSLKKLIYPESHPSIAFQLFSIPLSYVPAILRFVISPIISLIAWGQGNPHPVEPMKRAGAFLLDKTKKDLSRLIVTTTQVVYLLYSLAATMVKMFSYLGAMAIGRVAGLFDGKPAHAMHKMFASVHTWMRSMGEFFYPAKAMKHVAVAHPTDTMLKTEASYVTLLQQMGADKENSTPEGSDLSQIHNSEFDLLAKKSTDSLPVPLEETHKKQIYNSEPELII